MHAFDLVYIFLIVCSMSVEKYPNNPMLGRREIVDGKVLFTFFFLYFKFFFYRCIHLCVFFIVLSRGSMYGKRTKKSTTLL